MNGSSAFAFGDDQIAPIKTLSEFAKNHPALVLKVGIVDGEKADQAKLAEYATIPSRDELLSKFLGSIQSPVTNFARVLKQIAEKNAEA